MKREFKCSICGGVYTAKSKPEMIYGIFAHLRACHQKEYEEIYFAYDQYKRALEKYKIPLGVEAFLL